MTDKKIRVVHSPHPILPEVDRRQFGIFYEDGDTVASILKRAGVPLNRNSIYVQLNGVPVAREDFDKTSVKPTDQVTIRAAVEGGDGSNIIAAVLMIVLYIYAPYLAPYVQTGLGVSAATAQALVIVGGTLLIGALFPPTMPKFNAGGGADTSPTYSLEGGSNQPRPHQPLPLIIGEHKIIPDLAAAPYVEFSYNEQYLNQAFNFGLSDIELSDIKIGDTPLSSFSGVTTEISGDDGVLTTFAPNVDTTPGAELTHANPVIRTTSTNTVAIGLDFQGTIFATDKKGNFVNESCQLAVEYREVGASTWLPFAGVKTFTNGSTKPVRRTLYQQVPEGQYEVRVIRQTADVSSTDSKRQNTITWSGMRSYQKDDTDYTGQKRMAIRIRASGQLNGRIDNLSAIAKAKCPVWVDNEWTTQRTKNPAWWYLWFARGKFNNEGRRLFGAGLPDSRIDIERIIEWAAWCDAHELECNAVLDRSMSVWDVLSLIARCGRGTVSWGRGTLGVIWDQEGLPVTQMFGMSNIRQGSFGVDYISEKLADEIIINFVNPEIDWQLDSVRALMPGVTAPENTATYDIPGITNKDQAGREANLQAASQLYFRRRVSFETDYEGLVCSKGDVITVSHDLTNWGSSGRLEPGSTATVLKLSREVEFTADTQPYVSVRHPNGDIETVSVEIGEIGVPTDTLILESPLSANPSEDEDNDVKDYIWQFDPAATPGKKLKVIHMEPMGEHGEWVKIIARDENPAYYDAEDGSYEYIPPTDLMSGNPEITNVQVTEQLIESTKAAVRVYVTWDMKSALAARVRVAKAFEAFIDYGEIYGDSFDFVVDQPTTLTIELVPVSLVRLKGAPGVVTTQYTIRSLGALPENIPAVVPRVNGLQLEGDPTSREFTGSDAKFIWRKVASSAYEVGSELQGADSGGEDPYFKDFQVKILDVDGNVRRTEYVKDNAYVYTYEKNKEDGGGTPARIFTIQVRVRGTQNQLSDKPAQITVSNPAPPVPGGINVSAAFQMVAINYTLPADTDFAGVLVWMSQTSGFTPNESNRVLDINTNTALISNLVSGQTYYVRIAGYDKFGKDGLNISSEFEATTVRLETVDLDPEVFEGIEQIDNIANAIIAEQAARIAGDEVLLGSITTEQTTRESEDAALASQIDTVSAIASSRNRVFHQASAPTASATGDLWFDSDDGNKVYRWDGDSWEPTDDTRIAANAALIAAEATARADEDSALASSISSVQAIATRNVSFRQNSAPTGGTYQAGDLWFDTDDNNKVYRWNGTSWQATDDARITANAAAIVTEQTARADGDSALASSISTLTSTVNGHTTSISTQASTISGIQGKYSVKVDNNGYVSGFGLISTANNGTPTSQFTVLADEFAVVKPGSSAIQPFVISGGTCYMDNVVARNIGANVVTADKINVSSLSSITATIGTLRTASSGARTEIRDNLILVYDSSNVLRVRMGIW